MHMKRMMMAVSTMSEARMIQKAVVLAVKGKSTFMPKKPVTTVSGSMMVEK